MISRDPDTVSIDTDVNRTRSHMIPTRFGENGLGFDALFPGLGTKWRVGRELALSLMHYSRGPSAHPRPCSVTVPPVRVSPGTKCTF